MEITLDLPSNLEQALQGRASQQGLSLKNFIFGVLEKEASRESQAATIYLEETFEKHFQKWKRETGLHSNASLILGHPD